MSTVANNGHIREWNAVAIYHATRNGPGWRSSGYLLAPPAQQVVLLVAMGGCVGAHAK